MGRRLSGTQNKPKFRHSSHNRGFVYHPVDPLSTANLHLPKKIFFSNQMKKPWRFCGFAAT
jgi:hypothetical protein